VKYFQYIVICVVLLSCSSLYGQSVLAVSANQIKFLNSCSVLQGDIDVIHKLPIAGQRKILAILRNHGRECGDLKDFKNTRDYIRLYTPPPEVSPRPPMGWDMDFLTEAESNYMSKIDGDHLNKLFEKRNNR
jgi:hypothetical protein